MAATTSMNTYRFPRGWASRSRIAMSGASEVSPGKSIPTSNTSGTSSPSFRSACRITLRIVLDRAGLRGVMITFPSMISTA